MCEQLTGILVLGAAMAHAAPTVIEADIVIAGGSFSAPASALEAARSAPGAAILLIEPTDWLGGQATSQGVAAIDNAWHEPGASIMRNDPATYYPADYLDWIERLKNPPAEAPGDGYAGNGASWVTREAYDPRTAAWLLDQMMAEHPNITVMKMTVVKEVSSTAITDVHGEGRIITGLQLLQRTPHDGYVPGTKFLSEEITDWYSPADSADFTKAVYTVTARDPAKGMVVIDSSELGDVIVLSGADYVVGRELTTERMNEDGTPPAMDEDGTQSFVYPFGMTSADAPNAEQELKDQFAGFDAYLQEQTAEFFSMGAFSWNRIWTYRRLRNTGGAFQFDTVNQGDLSMQNWYPGNDYPYNTFLVDSATALAEAASGWFGGIMPLELANAEKHAVAWYFYMKERRTTPWDTRLARGNDPVNYMATAHGLAKFPYIRETRRIIGLENFRLTGRSFRNTAAGDYDGRSSFRFYDSVGIGNYAVDVHPTRVSTGITPPFHNAAPFYIPYRALGSANVRNLLAGGKLMAGTYITNAAYRLHPIEWAIGSAGGAAAAEMHLAGETNLDLLELPRLRALQQRTNQNSPISWAVFDADPIPPLDGDFIVNDFRPVTNTPFDIEIYHFRGRRAEIFLDGVLLGETTTRRNGRLVYTSLGVPAGSTGFTFKVYDGNGILLEETGAPTPPPFYVVDDIDPECVFSGGWIYATAQANKFGISYRYLAGNQPPGTATFNIPITRAGRYALATWYPQANNRAVDAPFTIHHRHGSTTVPINQQLNGGQWVPLGEFDLEPGSNARVVLSNNTSANPTHLVLADAVRADLIPAIADLWVLH